MPDIAKNKIGGKNMAKRKTTHWRIVSAVCGTLTAPLIGFTAWANSYQSLVCSVIGGQTSKIVKQNGEATTKDYKTNGQSLADWVKTEDNLIRRVQAEGSVLLKNKNNALPLAKGAKISSFGYGTINTVSTGMVRFGAPASYVDFKTAMEEDGKLELNPTVYDFYKEKSTAKLAFNAVPEVDVDEIGDSIRSSYASYKDAAIVVISRSGGEGGDLATGDFTGGTKYLALQESEKKMLSEVTSHFDKVIVLLNTSYPMELGWLEDYDIDACLMIGAVGYNGLNAVSDILVGKSNPCGKTVDTYAADSFSSPAMRNFGDYTYANGTDIENQIGKGANATKYVVEKEGIYVGYKYYETRYEDTVLGQGKASSSTGAYASATGWDYNKEVCYPFGYGLSYTTFSKTLKSVKENNNTYEVQVEVKNTGSVAGKEAVEVYAQTPYTDFDKQNKIEVPSVQLAGFAKTKEIAPGATETVSITIDKEDLAHYDSYVNKTYIMEGGTYYLTVGENAHAAINNILSAKDKSVDGQKDLVHKFTLANTDTSTYSVTDQNVRITNLFDDVDLNYWQDNSVIYLSRNNWESTWPTEVTKLNANSKMIDAMNIEGKYTPGSEDMSGMTLGADSKYTVAMMRDAKFDDPQWQVIINQLSIEDLLNLVGRSGLAAIESIAYPATFMKDGSHRVADRPYVENKEYAHVFPSEVIMGATYDRDILKEIGEAFGEDNLRTETVGHYAPSVNIHRTPYSGRNFEYYSEDGYLNGEMSVPEIEGMQEKGAVAFLKHFVLNDQETNRQGICTFTSQQAFREIYLEAFKAGLVEGKSKAIMGGFNRIGCTWTGADKALQTDLVRNEWDWKGILDTDAVFSYNEAMGFKSGLEAGTTMWATSGTKIYEAVIADAKKDSKMVANMRSSAHYLLYNVVNSLAFNGISSGDKIVPVMPWWLTTALVVDSVLAVATIVAVAFVAIGAFKEKE